MADDLWGTKGLYDEASPESIERYGQGLIGKTFAEVIDADEKNAEGISEYAASHENKKRKGGLGEIIEEKYFHYKCNNDSKPDFDKAGVELKVTPYKRNKNGSRVAKERLIITMIDYFKVIEEEFEESHLWQKARLILLVYYLYQSEIKDRLNYRIDFVKLFSVPPQDLAIMKHDFEVIVEKIRNGKAHELSEGDTLYLGAAPKAATSGDRRRQPCSDEPAKPRAFAFKNSYMTYVLNTFIIPGKSTYEPIVKEKSVSSFEEYVEQKIGEYEGRSVEDLCGRFGVVFEKRPKNLGAMLAYRMLGVRGNQAEEFVKANIAVKTIRIEKDGRLRESMSFPTFKFKELSQETWDDSVLASYLSETRFLFIVYKYDEKGVLRLKGCQFWNMPYEDINSEVYSVWKQTKELVNGGLEMGMRDGRYYSNFPKAKDNRVCHVRPHGRDAMDTDVLPDGRHFPKQCFWLNNGYILSQLKNEFLT